MDPEIIVGVLDGVEDVFAQTLRSGQLKLRLVLVGQTEFVPGFGTNTPEMNEKQMQGDQT